MRVRPVYAAMLTYALMAPDYSFAQTRADLAFVPRNEVEYRGFAHGQYALIPRSLGSVIERHVRAMLSAGHAQDISDVDLFHGHFTYRKECNFRSEKFSCISHILYHTDEELHRWKESLVEPIKRKQRSIVGFLDGSIVPAKDIIDVKSQDSFCSGDSETYRTHGTIFSNDLRKAIPGIITNYLCRDEDSYADFVATINRVDYIVDEMFILQKNPSGRFVNEKIGIRFEIYLRLNKKSR